MNRTNSIDADGPVLIFGGPYSNLQATEAVLAEARRTGIQNSRIICTGDLAAYCGDPVATIDAVRESGIHVVMGNCDEQIATSAQDCGCGFPEASLCERLSSAWFEFANAIARDDQRAWLAALPRRIDLALGGRKLAVIHGGVRSINQFVFPMTPREIKARDIQLAGTDGVIGGHCGMPFTQFVAGKLWHNAGVIGMPANDGTPRVWFSVLTPGTSGIKIEHRALSYDHAGAAGAMRRAGLPPEYRLALASGIWPSSDVLPARERLVQGTPLAPGFVMWPPPLAGSPRPGQTDVADGLRWPALLTGSATDAGDARIAFQQANRS